jgi:hypothetical protein
LLLVISSDAEREVQGGFEVVARIELFFGDCTCHLIGRRSAQGDYLYDTQRRLQSCRIENGWQEVADFALDWTVSNAQTGTQARKSD